MRSGIRPSWSRRSLHLKIGDKKPAEYHPPEPWEEDFAEGGSFRHVGRGSRIAEKMKRRGTRPRRLQDALVNGLTGSQKAFSP